MKTKVTLPFTDNDSLPDRTGDAWAAVAAAAKRRPPKTPNSFFTMTPTLTLTHSRHETSKFEATGGEWRFSKLIEADVFVLFTICKPIAVGKSPAAEGSPPPFDEDVLYG